MIWDVEREIVSFGPLALRWYSLLFASGIVAGYFIVTGMFKKEGKPMHLLDSLLFYIVVGTVVGARLGHCLFYEPADYLADPIRILYVWEGGLASHGGFTGVILALWLFSRRHPEIPFFWLADRISAPGMLGATLIRIGNFFNSEILGHPTDKPWGIVFKKHDEIARHPAQLYEALGYLVIAAIIHAVYLASDRKPKEGRLFGLCLVLGYGFRLFIERFKEVQVDFERDMALNMGQLLSVPFILIGLFFVFGGQYKTPWLRWGLSPEAGGPGAAADEPRAVAAEPVKSRKGELRKKAKKLKNT